MNFSIDDRTFYWFHNTYGLSLDDAERMAAYEAMTDAGHTVRVQLLMNVDHCTLDEALVIVSKTDAEFDQEELECETCEGLGTMPVCLGVCEGYCPDCNAFCLPAREVK